MCGIAGIIGPDRERIDGALERMTAALVHRGPDDGGMELHPFGSGWIGLGHRRLSILDLSALGRQPMIHRNTGCRIIFNGEIYNSPRLRKNLQDEGDEFRSTSDTEVLLAGLARHGPEYAKALEGMYAFAHYDPRQPRLILARDPAGMKPLFYASVGGYFIFASEVRSLLSSGFIPRTIDRRALAGFLAYGSLPQPLTLFESIRMAPPGAWQTIVPIDEGWKTESAVSWWKPPPSKPISPDVDVVAETRRRLDDAVQSHLLSDVPVGIFLSAGLDSTAIAGLAARHSTSVQTFTVGFQNECNSDELDLATRTARQFGLPHSAIAISPTSAEQAAQDWLAAADQPSLDGFNTFIISSTVRARGMKVALSGLGADELFGGYPSFRDVPAIRKAARRVRWFPGAIRRGIGTVYAARRTRAVRRKFADMLAGPADISTLTLQRRQVLSDSQLALLGIDKTRRYLPGEAEIDLPDSESDEGWAISVLESRFYQTNTLLRDSDANGMAHSLEIRLPFLDQRLLEWAHGLPSTIRFPRNRPAKYLLREALADVIPPFLLNRPKTGFTLPLRRWMLGSLRTLCEAGLSTLKDASLVRAEAVDAIWGEFLADTEERSWSRAFTLVVLGDYLRRHGG